MLLIMGCVENSVKYIEQEEELIIDSSSVCACTDSAIKIHLSLIEEEKKETKELFGQLREECLTKYGSYLFVPSDCNDVYYLELLADSLRTLGIDINNP